MYINSIIIEENYAFYFTLAMLTIEKTSTFYQGVATNFYTK